MVIVIFSAIFSFNSSFSYQATTSAPTATSTTTATTPNGCVVTYTLNSTGVSSRIASKILGLDMLANGSYKSKSTTNLDAKFVPKAVQ